MTKCPDCAKYQEQMQGLASIAADEVRKVNKLRRLLETVYGETAMLLSAELRQKIEKELPIPPYQRKEE